MLLPTAFALGALLGWRRASQRGGDSLDKWQYAAAHGIGCLLLALVGAIALQRFGLI